MRIEVDDASYTGSPVEPAVHFYIDGEECAYKLGEDYELEYSNNVAGGSVGDADQPTVRIRILDRNHLVAHDPEGGEVDFVDVPFNIRYTVTSLADASWELAASNALADASAGTLEPAAVSGTYAHPDKAGETLAVPASAYTIEAGVKEADGGFTAKERGWAAGNAVWYKVGAASGNPAFAGSVVLGPATVAAESAANSFARIGQGGCKLAVTPAGQAGWRYAYTGAQVRPQVLVADGDATLSEGRDYELAFGENVNAGQGSITVRGRGAYTGSWTQGLCIDRAQLSECSVEVSGQVFAGKGRGVEPDAGAVTVKLGDVALPASDWRLDRGGYGANTGVGEGAGTLTVVSDGTGNLAAGSRAVAFDIGRLGLTPERFEVKVSADRTYNASAQTLAASEVSVTDGETGDVLEYGVDYALNYPGDHTSAGRADVLVSGLGSYANSLSSSFEIRRADIGTAAINLDDAYEYTGGAVKPLPNSVRIELPDGAGGTVTRSLEERYTTTTGESFGEYTVGYENNTAVAAKDESDAPTLTLTGAGNFTGTASATFAIVGGVLNESTTTVRLPKSVYVYTARNIEPEPEVRYKGRLLGPGDYTVGYAGNREPGTATVTISAAGGNLSGSVSVEFRIADADLSKASVAAIPGQKYAFGEELRPPVTVTGSTGERLVAGVDYVAAYTDNTEIGTAHVSIGPAPGSAYTGTLPAEFKIVKIPIGRSDVRMSATSFEYDGAQHRPDIYIVVDNKRLVEGTDYELVWPEDTTNPGGKAVEIAVPKGSFYSSQVVVTYDITGEAPDTGGGEEDGGAGGATGGGEQRPAPVIQAGEGVQAQGASYQVTAAGPSDADRTVKLTTGAAGAKAVVPDTVRLSDGRDYRVTAIAAGLFAGSEATSLTVGRYVTAIPAGAFKSMPKLRSAVIGASVRSIGAGAFSGCGKLRTVTVKAKSLTKKKVKGCFKGLKRLTVKVSAGSKKERKKLVKKYKKAFTKKNCGVAKKLAVK